MEPISNKSNIIEALYDSPFKKESGTKKESTDSIEISNTAKVMNNIDKFMNLGRTDRADMSEMNSEEREEFIKMTADLIKHGIVGYEVLDVNGKPEKHDITLQIGDERLYGIKLYNKPGYYKDQSK
jgi:hypothetical protein